MKIIEQLATVQATLKAPKGQYNQFGKYNYRSCEDILEAVKPLLKEQGLTLTLDDSIESAGNRIYIKATAMLQNADGESIENHAFARESESKKGMDESQITGTASSYARKYALNGLFLIDDTKDADTDEFQKQGARPQPGNGKADKSEPHSLICDECGGPIGPMKVNGQQITAQEAANRFGKCVKCLRAGVKQNA